QTGQLPALKEAPVKRTRTPVIWALAGLLVGLLVALFLAPSGEVDLSSYKVTPLATDSSPEVDPVWSPDGQSVAYLRSVNDNGQLFVRSLSSTVPLQVTNVSTEESLSVSAPLIWTPDSASIYFLSGDGVWSVGAAGGEPQLLLREDGIISATLSPDGETLAGWTSTNEEGKVVSSLWISSPPGAELAPYEPSPFQVAGRWLPVNIGFSPDGTSVLLTMMTNDGAEAWLIPFPPDSGKEPERVFQSFLAGTFPPQFTWLPDSRSLVFAAASRLEDQQRLWIGDVRSGSARQITGGFGREDEPSASPDGRRIAFSSRTPDYNIVELPLDGSPMRDLLATSRQEYFAAWSPVRDQIAYVTNREGATGVWIRNLAEGTDRPVVGQSDFSEDAKQFITPDFSPDGSRLVYAVSTSDTLASIWISPVSGGTPTRVSPANQLALGPAWSSDGNWIAYLTMLEGRIRLVKSRVGGREPATVLADGGCNDPPSWSNDGKWLSCSQNDDLLLVPAE
ncbi:MAG: hypothetical protein GY953_40325, partial [bacterium]|nr:hypothetical protein [bacterium]